MVVIVVSMVDVVGRERTLESEIMWKLFVKIKGKLFRKLRKALRKLGGTSKVRVSDFES